MKNNLLGKEVQKIVLSKLLIILNIIIASGSLFLGVKVSQLTNTNHYKIPELKIKYVSFKVRKEVIKLSYSELPRFVESKSNPKKLITTPANVSDSKTRVDTEKIEYLAASAKKINIELESENGKDKENIKLPELKNKILKVESKFINNRELIEMVGYEQVTIQETNWVAFLDNEKIEEKLLAIKDLKSSTELVAENITVTPTKHNNELATDQVSHQVAAVKKETKEAIKDELVFFEYGTPEGNQIDEIKEDAPKDIQSGNLAKKTFLASNVQKAIEREMSSHDEVKLAESSVKAISPQPINQSDIEDNDEPEEPVLNTTVIRAIEVNLRNKQINKVNTFNFTPDYDQNQVYESDRYDSSLALNFNLNNDYSVVRGRLDSQGMLLTRLEVPLLNNHSAIEVPLFNQQEFFNFLEEKDVHGYGGHYLIDLGNTDIVDVDLISINSEGKESYEHRIFMNEEFKEVEVENGFRYVLFMNVNPGVVMVKYLSEKGDELQKPSFVLPDELLFEPTFLNDYQDQQFELFERTSLAKTLNPRDIAEKDIIDFYSGVSPVREALNKYTINNNLTFLGFRKYLELSHLDSPIIVGHSNKYEIEIPSIDYIQNIMKELDLTLERECLIQLNPKKNILNIQMYGEATNGPLGYENRYLGSDGYFTKELNGNSEKLYLIGMEPGVISLKIEYSNNTSEYFQTFCSEGSYLVEQL